MPGGHLEHLGDLLVVEAAEVPEDDRGAELRAQALQSLVDIDAGGDLVVDGPRHRRQPVVVGERSRRSSASAADLVEAGVGGDPVDPASRAGPDRRSGAGRGRR